MNRFPVPDMAGALRLTRQGRLKEAMALLNGRPASATPAARWDDATAAGKPGGFQLLSDMLKSKLENVTQLDPGSFLKRPGRPGTHKAPEPAPDGSRFEARSFASDAGSRNYKLFVPGGYAGQAVPLVVMLHGCTQSPDDFAAGTRMNILGQERNFLVAYPEQARTANVSKCWNWFNPADQRRDNGEPALLAGITREIMREFRVQPERVYIAGLSAGGAAAAIMGAAYPELFAAIGVHSGLACGAASDLPSALAAMQLGAAAPVASFRPGRLVPAIVFHGDKDATVNIANGGQVIAQARGTAKLQTRIMSGESGGRRYERTVLSNDSGAGMLEEWILHGAGHAWSGGSPAGSFTDPQGPDASREMIRFFLQHTLVG